MTKAEIRPESVQPHFGEAQATKVGTLPTGFTFMVNGAEIIRETYGSLNTDLERQAFFDEFLTRQKRSFPTAWVAIYETVDLIRRAEWYWQGQGYDSFEAFWREQGEALFGRWADLEQTYQYAHLAAPQLFEVQYEEAKAIAQELAQFRSIPAANPNGVREPGGKRGPQLPSAITRGNSPINPEEYVEELNHPEFIRGRQTVQNKGKGGTDRFKRFARIRRDAPDIAERFLAGEFVKRYKNGTIQPDLVAAEYAAGIRTQQNSPSRRDGLTYCKKLASSLNRNQLIALRDHLNSIIESKLAEETQNSDQD